MVFKTEHSINYKHGMRYSVEYSIFCAAKNRCNNPNVQSYKSHGSRGIKFLYKNIVEFVADIGLRPSKKHQIDRINNNGNYEIGNCRWILAKKNCANRREKTINNPSRGVYWHKGKNKWLVSIWKDKKHINIGTFDHFEDAHQEFLTYYFLANNCYPPEFY